MINLVINIRNGIKTLLEILLMYLFFKCFTFDTKIMCVCFGNVQENSTFRFRVNLEIAPRPIFGCEIRYLFLTKKKL